MRGGVVEVALGSADLRLLEPYLRPGPTERLRAGRIRAHAALAGHRVWAVSSTAAGGGVATMMRTLLPYWRGAGIDVRWIVITGPHEFFRVTKRLHNWLHGSLGDCGPLGPDQFALLRRTASAQSDALIARVAPGDTVVLHDPQTASLVAPLKCAGARVVWRCHIGADRPNERVERAWEWLLPQVARADALVFTRTAFVPPVARAAGIRIITPAIDPASLKNQPLSPELARAIGQQMGVVRGQPTHPPHLFRADGSVIRITRRAQILGFGPPPRAGIDPIVLSLSRWDRLKDQIGIIAAFAQHVLPSVGSAHLIVAGPETGAIQDDPESHEAFDEVRTAWERLPTKQRCHVHLASLPFDPLDENAAMVNALQTLADVVVKKSIQEGLGLGVTEALWKARPVVATRVGGHREQIRDGYHGLLVDDPNDLDAFGSAIVRLLHAPDLAARLGRAGRERVRQRFLADRYFLAWTKLLGDAGRFSAPPRGGRI